jgi:tRNA pseudouridine38-40 synthase
VQTYRVDLAYKGAQFNGWQTQPDGSGIQDHIEKVLEVILKEPIRLSATSRTDSGVHAEQQVAVFKCAHVVDEPKVLLGLKSLLPQAIAVRSIKKCAPEFYPAFDSKAKTYIYRIWNQTVIHPFWHPYVWSHAQHLDEKIMAEGAKIFVGEHDFSSFCVAGSNAKTRVREIYGISVRRVGPMIEVAIVGAGFLKQMVRSIVGTLVDAAMGRYTIHELEQILQAKDRSKAGKTAPASGLTLHAIYFDHVPTIKELVQQYPRYIPIGESLLG